MTDVDFKKQPRCTECGHREWSHWSDRPLAGSPCFVATDGQAIGPGLEDRTPCSCPGYAPEYPEIM